MKKNVLIILFAGFIIAVFALALSTSALRAAEKKGSSAGTQQTGKIPFPKPDSHKGNWIEYHGADARLNIGETGLTGNACLACHERNDCITCHNTRLPRDHTNFWRTRGHGLTAEGNRERCLACHRQDYCVRCHNETAPRTHRGRWNAITRTGTPDAPTHCMWCHFDGGVVPADNCVVCHKQAPHTSAPGAPHPPIGAQTDCTLCHK